MVMNGEWQYTYDGASRRVVEFRDMPDADILVVTLRAGGTVLGRYTYTGTALTEWKEYRYLGGRRIDVGSDRLGSDLSGGKVLLPYGEELVTPPPPNPYSPYRDSKLTFATYWRDEASGFDYADQRYYGPGTGRFLSADPYVASGGARESGELESVCICGGGSGELPGLPRASVRGY
jgi:RHS repeat-associated protein